MKTTNTPVRQIGVIKEEKYFSDYQKSVYNIWFDGNEVMETLSIEELTALRDIMSEVIVRQEGGQK